jgi:tetratricopeptide (TPR) repeat protein
LIARSPDFAPPRASLASVLNVRHILRPGTLPSPADIRAARGHASLAVTLDPLDARNHLALAWSAALEGSHDEAGLHLDMATSLNPYSPNTTISAAMGYAFLGDHERAQRVLDDALRLTPMLRSYHWCYAAAVRFLAGDDAGAIAASLRSGDQIADNQGWLAAALARSGRVEDARAAFVRLVDILTPLWGSDAKPSPEAVHSWFVSAYPIRREEDRSALSDALRRSMQPQQDTVSGSGGT